LHHVHHFAQECPVCGRPLQIRVEYLGRSVNCQHCGGRFVASGAQPDNSASRDNPLLARAEKLLAMSDRRLRGSRETMSD
jgi:hypothetical protein